MSIHSKTSVSAICHNLSNDRNYDWYVRSLSSLLELVNMVGDNKFPTSFYLKDTIEERVKKDRTALNFILALLQWYIMYCCILVVYGRESLWSSVC